MQKTADSSAYYITWVLILLLGVVTLASCISNQTKQNTAPRTPIKTESTPMVPTTSYKTLADFPEVSGKYAVFTTSKGTFTAELFTQDAPLNTRNFITLANSGFYNGTKFHRVIADFMAQGGDPLSKDESQKQMWGTGGPGYTIQDEFVTQLKHDSAGILSMAKTQAPNSGGSQFFITFGPTPHLDGAHAVFGKVTEGMDVVNTLAFGDTIETITIKE